MPLTTENSWRLFHWEVRRITGHGSGGRREGKHGIMHLSCRSEYRKDEGAIRDVYVIQSIGLGFGGWLDNEWIGWVD